VTVSRDDSAADILFMLEPLRKRLTGADLRPFSIENAKKLGAGQREAGQVSSGQGESGHGRSAQAIKLPSTLLCDSLRVVTCSEVTNAPCCASQRLFLRFQRLFCRITGKWLDTGATNGEYKLISGGLPSSAAKSLLCDVILKKIPVLRL
jgi:hypothetical protein